MSTQKRDLLVIENKPLGSSAATRKYDLLVIGSGAAGSAAATTAAKEGLRVAMAEKGRLGGTCLNYGCDPTKTMIHVAHLLHQSHQFPRYGLQIGTVEIDWAGIMARVQQVVKEMRGGNVDEAEENLKRQGVDVINGTARFQSPSVVEIGGHKIQATDILIATGTEAAVLPVAGLKEAGFITNIEAVALAQLPKRLAVVGGGPIGIEFAQMFRRFGVEVTVLEHSPRILDTEDQEIAADLHKILEDAGIRIETGVEMERVSRAETGKHIIFRCGDRSAEELIVDEILISAGRKPVIDELNLEAAGVETTKEGIKVDSYMRTNVPHIYAIGDVTGGYQFTHVADAQAKLVVGNLVEIGEASFDDCVIPWVTYTDPELAHVGKTEEELKKADIFYKVARLKFEEVERAKIDDATVGSIKLLVGTDGKILGGHILASRAGELVAPIVLAMQNGLRVGQLANTILPYPTMSEAIRQAASQLI